MPCICHVKSCRVYVSLLTRSCKSFTVANFQRHGACWLSGWSSLSSAACLCCSWSQSGQDIKGILMSTLSTCHFSGQKTCSGLTASCQSFSHAWDLARRKADIAPIEDMKNMTYRTYNTYNLITEATKTKTQSAKALFILWSEPNVCASWKCRQKKNYVSERLIVYPAWTSTDLRPLLSEQKTQANKSIIWIEMSRVLFLLLVSFTASYHWSPSRVFTGI